VTSGAEGCGFRSCRGYHSASSPLIVKSVAPRSRHDRPDRERCRAPWVVRRDDLGFRVGRQSGGLRTRGARIPRRRGGPRDRSGSASGRPLRAEARRGGDPRDLAPRADLRWCPRYSEAAIRFLVRCASSCPYLPLVSAFFAIRPRSVSIFRFTWSRTLRMSLRSGQFLRMLSRCGSCDSYSRRASGI
jgi:hypothetical protein